MWKPIDEMPLNVFRSVFIPMARSRSGGVTVRNVKRLKNGKFIGLDNYKNEKPPEYFWDDGA